MKNLTEIQLLHKIITEQDYSGDSGVIRFKYYSDFHKMEKVYNKCNGELYYIGNSKYDGAPIFEYKYKNIDINTLTDFKKLNIFLRRIKLEYYSNKTVNPDKLSLLSFMKFFMNSIEENEIKNTYRKEIIFYNYETNELMKEFDDDGYKFE